MNSSRKSLVFILNFIRCIPHIIVYLLHKNRPVILVDIKRGLEEFRKEYGNISGLIYLFAFLPAFRNVFYYRVSPYDFFLKILCPPERTLAIITPQIGEGLVVSHGFSTAIGAKSIGKNCTILQQVTIGATKYGEPVIKDNVVIYAGAVIFGKITIGNNVVIGANATVFIDVPDNCTVLPGTSKIMRWKSVT
jgi:serine O-acetyltransferase